MKGDIPMKTRTLRFLLLIALVFGLLTPSTITHAAGVLYAKPVASGTGVEELWQIATAFVAVDAF